MLFSSVEYIFGFLPATLILYFVLRGYQLYRLSLCWLTLASLFFYGWWNPKYLVLIVSSMLFNYVMGRQLHRLWEKRARHPALQVVLALSVFVNLAALAYFKYAGFFQGTVLGELGVHWTIATIVLPLGISFFTFTQIAFLVDASQGLAEEADIIGYGLFVTFFPHLIAGPILHHAEMMPQFRHQENLRFRSSNIQAGLMIFLLGLFKKVALADTVAAYCDPLFALAMKEKLDFFQSWIATVAYTLQIYFDFSGYCDMAIGAALMLGIVLPLNFNAPYKARSIIDFWKRWHITLSRFLRDYVYIPLGGNRKGPNRRYMNLMATMLLGGLWHGAGWTFVLWGGLHGFYLVINHLWRSLSKPFEYSSTLIRKAGSFFSTGLTLLCVMIAWVFFRASSLDAAINILCGMAALHGGQWSSLSALGGKSAIGLLSLFFAIVWLGPTSQQWLENHYLQRGVRGGLYSDNGCQYPLPLFDRDGWTWLPTTAQGIIAGVVAFFVMKVTTNTVATPFLYFNF